jgi:hypothetical protein
MGWRQRKHLSAAQQYVALRSNPLCVGHGVLGRGQLVWSWQVAPSALGRVYTLRVVFKEGEHPTVFVDQPDLVALAGGRNIPHVYGETPVELCLYLPRSGEWHGGLLIAKTTVPWAALWLFYFEDWLVSSEWKGGGVHPGDVESNGQENFVDDQHAK